MSLPSLVNPINSHTASAQPGKNRKSIFYLCAIALIACLSYWKSLQCFFFADDLLCLDYLQQIFHGSPNIFLQRLTGPWQDTSISLLYRPLTDVSLAIDYAFWHSNSVGYHITNLVLHLGASIACYHVIETVLRFNNVIDRTVPAFLSAAIFAASPLHVEPVMWICCRADLASTSLVLVFLAISIRCWHQRVPLSIVACVSYTSALLFKESAACSLGLIVLYLLLHPAHATTDRVVKSLISKQSFSETAKFVCPLLALTFTYFAIRMCVLGTFIGGYTGALGASLSDTLLKRLSDPDLASLVALAANVYVFKDDDPLLGFIHCMFFAMAGILLVRIPFQPWTKNTGKLLLFFAAATICCLMPALQVAGLTPTLTNSRIFYLASAFFLPLVVLAIFPLKEVQFERTINRWIRTSSTAIFSAVVIAYIFMCNASINPWLQGSQILQAVQKETAQKIIEARRVNKNAQLLVLNMPATFGGAHLMYEFREMAALVGPAFFPGCDYQSSLSALDEYPDFVAARMQTLKSRMQDPNLSIFSFSQRSRKLHELISAGFQTNHQNKTKESSCSFLLETKTDSKEKIYFAETPDTEAFSPDQIQFEIEFQPSPNRPLVSLALTTNKTVPEEMELFFLMFEHGKQGRQVITLPVSALQRSVGNGPSNQCFLRLSDSCKLLNLNHIHGKRASCLVDLKTASLSKNGKYLIRKGTKATLHLSATCVPNAKGLYLELSKPNHFLHFSSTDVHLPVPSKHTMRSWNILGSQTNFDIDASVFREDAFYQLRACATDSNGNLIGYFSDPIEFDFRKVSSNHKNFY